MDATSGSHRLHELLDGDTGLLEDTGQRADLELAVQRQHIAAGASARGDVAPLLPHDGKAWFPNARKACAPETCGRLGGTGRNLEGGQQRLAAGDDRKFFKIQLGRFLKVGQRLLDRRP